MSEPGSDRLPVTTGSEWSDRELTELGRHARARAANRGDPAQR
jgi:hypothetical protein